MNKYNRSVRVLVGALIAPLWAGAQDAEAPVATPAENAPAAEVAPSTPEAPADAPPADAPAASEKAPKSDLTLLPPPAPEPASLTTESITEKQKDTLSVDFPDEDIRNILRNVADLFELNIVVPDALQGRTSIKLRDVTWRQIFKVVLSPVGYTFVEDGNIIKVVTLDSLALEPLSTEVFVLNYARAEEIDKSILPLVDSATGGRVLVDKRINALIISERPSRLARITPVLEALDKATDQVMIETKFIEVNEIADRQLGLDWTAVGGVTTGAGANAVANGRNATPYTTGAGGVFPQGYSYSTAVLSNVELASTLQFLQSSGDSKVVSNPTVVTLNNVEAFINVGKEWPIPSYTYNTERGSFEVSGFEYKPIGIILKVTPQINSRGFIKMMVEPEISSSDRVAYFGGTGTSPAAEIPIIESRKTRTQVSLQDGHTLGIGGLISEIKTSGDKKLPLLGDIPGVGRLFTSKSKGHDRRNLLIFITAKIVSSEAPKPEEIFDPRLMKGVELRRSDLPGQRATGAEAFLPEITPEAKK